MRIDRNLYFNKNDSYECKGYYDFLTKFENMKLISAFADILSVFAHYQKKLQSDSITMLDISKQTLSVKQKLDGLKQIDLIGGWVSTLNENLKNLNEDENTIQLHGIKLKCEKPKRLRQHHLFVTERRSADSIINDAIESLKNFLDERLSLDDTIVTSTTPFVTSQPEADLEEVHKTWGSDLNLEFLGHEYNDILEFE